MLQLVQSPSSRVQRLIKEECNGDEDKRVRSGNRFNLAEADRGESGLVDNDYRVTLSTHHVDSKDKPGSLETIDRAGKSALDDQGVSESLVDEVNSFVGSYSSTSQDRMMKPTSVRRINRMVDKGNGRFVVASSSSISSAAYPSKEGSDRNDDNIQADDTIDEEGDGRSVGEANDGAEDYETQ